MKAWSLLAFAISPVGSPAPPDPARWEIVQKATLTSETGYSGVVDDEMITGGPRDGDRFSLIQLLFRTDPVEVETLELYLNVYKCTSERDHTSTHMILWRKVKDDQNIEMVVKSAIPQMNFLLESCGFKSNAADLFAGDFQEKFRELSGRNRDYVIARRNAAMTTKSTGEQN